MRWDYTMHKLQAAEANRKARQYDHVNDAIAHRRNQAEKYTQPVTPATHEDDTATITD